MSFFNLVLTQFLIFTKLCLSLVLIPIFVSFISTCSRYVTPMILVTPIKLVTPLTIVMLMMLVMLMTLLFFEEVPAPLQEANDSRLTLSLQEIRACSTAIEQRLFRDIVP